MGTNYLKKYFSGFITTGKCFFDVSLLNSWNCETFKVLHKKEIFFIGKGNVAQLKMYRFEMREWLTFFLFTWQNTSHVKSLPKEKMKMNPSNVDYFHRRIDIF